MEICSSRNSVSCVVLVSRINICTQMYSSESMYMLSSQFSIRLTGMGIVITSHVACVRLIYLFTLSSLSPPLLLSSVPWFLFFFFQASLRLSAPMQTWCDLVWAAVGAISPTCLFNESEPFPYERISTAGDWLFSRPTLMTTHIVWSLSLSAFEHFFFGHSEHFWLHA